MDKKEIYGKFLKGIIFWGRLTLLLALVLSFAPAAYLALFHGIMPPGSAILKALGMIAAIMVTSWIVEPIAYFPILGTSGTYMSWLAGNISNMRVPVSALAQDVAGVKEGTPEVDVISTLGIGISVIINLIILILAVIGGTAVINALPANIRTAFNYILPAVFGAILANFALRDLKLGVIALILAFGLVTLGAPTWVVLPVCVFGIIALGILFYNMKNKKTKKTEAEKTAEKEEG
jgi:hypothetical protein